MLSSVTSLALSHLLAAKKATSAFNYSKVVRCKFFHLEVIPSCLIAAAEFCIHEFLLLRLYLTAEGYIRPWYNSCPREMGMKYYLLTVPNLVSIQSVCKYTVYPIG